MRFYKHLYIGDSVQNPDKVKRKLKHHKGQLSIYVICLAPFNDQLEIMHAAFLKQKYFRYHPPVVIGIASGYDEAVSLIVKMSEECVRQLGTCNLKEFLKEKAKQ